MYPAGIDADRSGGRVTVTWEDGHVSEFEARVLRWACPCAECSGEFGRPGRLASLTQLPAAEMRLADVQLVGSYALTPVWESGHKSGIYSWELLRSLCPCDDCSP